MKPGGEDQRTMTARIGLRSHFLGTKESRPCLKSERPKATTVHFDNPTSSNDKEKKKRDGSVV